MAGKKTPTVKTGPIFYLVYSERGAAQFTSPAANKGVAQTIGGAASRTLTLAHHGLSGTLAKKVRHCTAARPKYKPGTAIIMIAILIMQNSSSIALLLLQ